MKKFNIKMNVTFEVDLVVLGENEENASYKALNHFGFVRGVVQCVNTNIIDYDVPVHGKKSIEEIKEVTNG